MDRVARFLYEERLHVKRHQFQPDDRAFLQFECFARVVNGKCRSDPNVVFDRQPDLLHGVGRFVRLERQEPHARSEWKLGVAVDLADHQLFGELFERPSERRLQQRLAGDRNDRRRYGAASDAAELQPFARHGRAGRFASCRNVLGVRRGRQLQLVFSGLMRLESFNRGLLLYADNGRKCRGWHARQLASSVHRERRKPGAADCAELFREPVKCCCGRYCHLESSRRKRERIRIYFWQLGKWTCGGIRFARQHLFPIFRQLLRGSV